MVERVAEPLAALVPSFAWPAEELREAWRLLLWKGAHDSVCGCSVDRVARDVDGRTARAGDLARGVADRALAALAARLRDPGTLTLNPCATERDGIPPLGWRLDAPGPAWEPVAMRVHEDHV